MRIRNVTTRRISIGNPSVTLGPGQQTDIDTLAGLASPEVQSYIQSRSIVVISYSTPGYSQLDSFISAETEEGSIDSGDATDLTDGGDSTLHFHASDRSRANHTGTQTKSTISDFAHGASSHTGAIGTLSQISDVLIAVADLNALDDGANTTLHFHDSDRARANHTGTQTKSTISDFSHGASDHSGAIGTLSQISDVTRTVTELNNYLPSSGATAGRPGSPAIGFMYFDTDLGANGGQPIWWNGTAWVYADGTLA